MPMVIDNGNETPPRVADRWTPRHEGDVYCSPACGFHCKKADFDKANERAQFIAAQLGTGWQPKVWENMGWHFEAEKRGATVTQHKDGLYSASIRFRMDANIEQCVTQERDTPREAVQAVVEIIAVRMAALQRALLSLSLGPVEIEDARLKE